MSEYDRTSGSPQPPAAEEPAAADAATAGTVTTDTVEQVVRRQLSKALGGKRGMVEAAVPTLTFTVSYLVLQGRDGLGGFGLLENPALEWAIALGLGVAALLAVVRIVQRGSTQFVFNGLFGIAIASIFAARSGQAEDAFLPGIIYNAVYAVVLILTVLIRWPAVGIMIGGVTGDLTSWRANPAIVTLSSRLTWLLVVPCVVRVAVQLPLYLAASAGSTAAFGALGAAKIGMGWPLQVAAFAGMAWLLARNKTPMHAAPRE
jgi:hypothetical protein